MKRPLELIVKSAIAALGGAVLLVAGSGQQYSPPTSTMVSRDLNQLCVRQDVTLTFFERTRLPSSDPGITIYLLTPLENVVNYQTARKSPVPCLSPAEINSLLSEDFRPSNAVIRTATVHNTYQLTSPMVRP